MKLANHLLILITLYLLQITQLSAQAGSSCAIATYDSETNRVAIPCVIFGIDQLEMNLLLQSEDSWAMNELDFSTCKPTADTCAVLDDDFHLTLPIDVLGQEYAAKLHYTGHFIWQLVDAYPVTADNTVILKPSTPNINGSFEELYLLDGPFYETGQLKVKPELGTHFPEKQIDAGEEYTLRIFHINDIHNNLVARLGDPHRETHYFSQIVKFIKDAKANAQPNETVLFLSTGDDHIGNSLDELLGFSPDSFQASAAYRAFTAAGLDIGVIGNHELDRGPALLAKAIETDVTFPILSANLFGSAFLGPMHYSPAAIAVANGLRIGFIGLTSREDTILHPETDPDLDVADYLSVLQNTLPYLDPLVDVVLVLSHMSAKKDIKITEEVANLTSKPIIVIGGHSHDVLNEQYLTQVNKTVPILQTGAYSNHLGETVISLYQTAAGSLRSHVLAQLHKLKLRDDRPSTIAAVDYNPMNFEQPEDYDVDFEREVMQPIYELLADRLQEVIGHAEDLENLTTEATITKRYTGEMLLANFMNDAIQSSESQQIDIAGFNGSGFSSGITPGAPISFNDWYGVMPFSDYLVIVEMTGQQIQEMLNSNAKRIVRPEELAENGGMVTFDDLSGLSVARGFIHFSRALRYTIKLNANATEAVAIDITINDAPIDQLLNETFKVAFGDFIAEAGRAGWSASSNIPGFADDTQIVGYDIPSLPQNNTGLVYRNEIVAFIRKVGTIGETTGAVLDGRLQIVE